MTKKILDRMKCAYTNKVWLDFTCPYQVTNTSNVHETIIFLMVVSTRIGYAMYKHK